MAKGEFIDQTNGKGDDSAGVRWLLSEASTAGVLRDMENPPAYSDPDKVCSYDYCTGEGDLTIGGFDNGGVHLNSGVVNKAAFLMTDGGSFNGQTVKGLGIDKVSAIFYEVQTNLLTSGSDFQDLYYALPQACQNLFGTNGIVSGDCDEV